VKTWPEMTIAERHAAMVSRIGAALENAHFVPADTPSGPWSEKVMVIAGHSFSSGPWLWLCCRDCGWYLGYSSQYGIEALAAAAKAHEANCEASDAAEALIAESENYCWASPDGWGDDVPDRPHCNRPRGHDGNHVMHVVCGK
jgi:hypothetical protein